MAWRSVRTTTSAAGLDAVNEALEALGALSVTWSAEGDAVVLEPAPGATPLWSRVCVDALFDLDVDTAALSSTLTARLAQSGTETPTITTRIVEDADWSNTWRAFAAPLTFADRLTIVPRDWTAAATGAVLRLDPGLAFGTGTHPTTALCLDWLARFELANDTVADFGCGSGILAIAACLLGARCAVAIDHDPQARLAARENAAFNAIATERLRVLAPDEASDGPYDVVVANILADALIALAPRFERMVKPGGALLLSGVRDEQVDRVLRAQPRFVFAAPAVRDGWVAVAGTRS